MLAGARAAAPLTLGDLIDGIAFGAVANGLGIGLVKATVMSLSAFSGSAQYAALTVLRDHGSVPAVLAAVVALNARYLVFGAQLSPALSPGLARRLGESQLITDTSWGLAMKRDDGRRAVLIGAGLSSLLAWSTGSALGALAGGAVSDYRAVGIDAALPTFFLCLLLERVSSGGGARRALLGGAGAVVLAPLLPNRGAAARRARARARREAAMSWALIGALGVLCFALRVAGPLLLRGRELPHALEVRLEGAVVPLVAALIATQLFNERRPGDDRRAQRWRRRGRRHLPAHALTAARADRRRGADGGAPRVASGRNLTTHWTELTRYLWTGGATLGKPAGIPCSGTAMDRRNGYGQPTQGRCSLGRRPRS